MLLGGLLVHIWVNQLSKQEIKKLINANVEQVNVDREVVTVKNTGGKVVLDL